MPATVTPINKDRSQETRPAPEVKLAGNFQDIDLQSPRSRRDDLAHISTQRPRTAQPGGEPKIQPLGAPSRTASGVCYSSPSLSVVNLDVFVLTWTVVRICIPFEFLREFARFVAQ
jgi:hypothetical protein